MVGGTLSHYRIIEKLGEGGMGVVYRARDIRLERDVAVKVLPPDALSSDDARQRFRREALALSRMNHPNIAVVHDFDTHAGTDFIVMECVPGNSLADRIAGAPLPEKELAAIGQQIASALEEAHEHSVIHRDLKPSNVMVTPKGQVKVLDFGLARILHPVTDEALTVSLSRSQQAVGTLPYMAPEQVRGRPADARTDIHALGCILFEMATGQRLFAGRLVTELIDAILQRPPQLPRLLNPHLSAELERIILKCLEKDPEDRYQSAKELAVDLRRFLNPTVTATVPSLPPPAGVRRRTWTWAVGIAVLIAILTFTFDVAGVRTRLFRGGSPPGQIRSLAVLPLENLSRDSEQDYFVDGMTDALTTELSKISELKVKSWTSASQYRGRGKPLQQIARELGVDAVVEGSVLHVGERVRITAQLIEASSDTHLWVQEYERDMRNVLAVHREVARAVAGEIRLALAREHSESPVATRPVNPAAYEAYLRGRDHWRRRGVLEFRRSLEYFEQAIAADPEYAPAYAGLADAYSSLAAYNALPTNVAYPKAKEAARRAVQLDDTLAEAHASLGTVAELFEWDWQEAIRRYHRAIELNPSYATGHQSLGELLINLGRFEEARPEVQLARDLNPLSPGADLSAGKVDYYARRYPQAIRSFEKTIETYPGYFIATFYLSLSLHNSGKTAKAIAVLEPKALQADIPELKMGLATYYAAAGRKSEADRLLAGLQREKQTGGLPAFILVAPYIGLKQYDRALAWMEQAYQERNWQMVFIGVEPLFDPLRSDPRFQELMRRMNFPAQSPQPH